MITKKRVVLVAKNERLKVLKRFEALEHVAKAEDVQGVWLRNKTPILTNPAELAKITGYNILHVSNVRDDIEGFISFCHANGFECGEYTTGVTYDTSKDRCFLCELANHRGLGDLSHYNQYVDKPVDCIVYESDNFYVVPELGALKLGYLMIVPKKHILSVAQFPKELMPEYQEVCEDVEKILIEAFDGKVVTFMEHGSGPSGRSSHKKSIVHAHTHVVVDWVLKEHFKKMVQLRRCYEISEAAPVHYFSYQEGAKGELLISMDPSVYVQRQFPRQVMAEELGYAPGQYNWRNVAFEENTDATLFRIYCMLCKCTNKRILARARGFIVGFAKRHQDD